jgi:hypothetical protein
MGVFKNSPLFTLASYSHSYSTTIASPGLPSVYLPYLGIFGHFILLPYHKDTIFTKITAHNGFEEEEDAPAAEAAAAGAEAPKGKRDHHLSISV